MGDLLEPRADSERRALGFWLCLALVVGNFIGSGIFLLPAQLAPYGWNAIFGWLVTIGGGVCLAFVFARLAAGLPGASGPHAYVEDAFGPVVAHIVSWSYWVSIVVGNTALATAAVSYLSLDAPALATVPGLGALLAIGLIWTLTIVNSRSVRVAGRIQAVTVVLKLLPLAAVIVVTAIILIEGRQEAAPPLRAEDLSLGAINGAATLTLWAMLGVECGAWAARKVRDPGRNVPRATIANVAIAAQRGLVHVIGTTGLSASDNAIIKSVTKQAVVVQAGNMSLGVNLLAALVKRVARSLDPSFDIEIVEMHHKAKIDAPSGTALMLGEAAAAGRNIELHDHSARGRDGITGARRAGDIGFAALRGGTVTGDHTVIFAGPYERIELTHKAEDRMIFAHGALKAAMWAKGKPPGLYSMADVLGLSDF